MASAWPPCRPGGPPGGRRSVAERLLAHIAADENLHMVFHRDLIAAALALAPEQVVIAIAAEAAGFQMPGAAVPGFLRRSMLIAHAGIYDVRLHRDEVVAPSSEHAARANDAPPGMNG